MVFETNEELCKWVSRCGVIAKDVAVVVSDRQCMMLVFVAVAYVGKKDSEPKNEHISWCMSRRSLSLFSCFQIACMRHLHTARFFHLSSVCLF